MLSLCRSSVQRNDSPVAGDIPNNCLAINHNQLNLNNIKLDVVEFVTNKSNVEPASEYIHKQLPFAVRLVLIPKKIAKMIEDNHNFIVAKAKEYSENKKA